MNQLLREIRRSPLLWLLAIVPVVLVASRLAPDAHTLLFVLSVAAIIPLAMLLSRATEAIASRTGDAVGGLLNATLGNLTELVIALSALRAGEYMLVKASIAGAIVTNTLFMLGASFLLGGLKHHVQEYNRVVARVQSGLLFLATVGLLVPSVVSGSDAATAAFTQKFSLVLAVVLLLAYGLSLLFSLGTHREQFRSIGHDEESEEPEWPVPVAVVTLAGVTTLVAMVSEIFMMFNARAAIERYQAMQAENATPAPGPA